MTPQAVPVQTGTTAIAHDDVSPGATRTQIPRRVNALEEMFGRQPTGSAELPDPAPLVRNLAFGTVLALLGEQRPEQIGRWLMPGVFSKISRHYATAARAQLRAAGRARRIPASLGTTRLSTVADGVVEASATVIVGGRTRAVALRLEGFDHRWFATELHVL
jgi:Family of unknown function (DUF6459)